MGRVSEFVPTGPVTVSATVLVPALTKVCVNEVATVLVVVPSPKSQNRFVIVPLDESVNVTVKGFSPLSGVPLKLALGTIAPVPMMEFVLLPSLLVVKTTTLLKLAALAGVKRTTRLDEPNPGRLKGVPERMVKGPPLTVATPLLKVAPPRLVMVKEA